MSKSVIVETAGLREDREKMIKKLIPELFKELRKCGLACGHVYADTTRISDTEISVRLIGQVVKKPK
jgi:hypothetical protein